MRRADSICRAAVATSRRRQQARLLEALELMASTPARTADEESHKQAAIQDLLRRNSPVESPAPTGG